MSGVKYAPIRKIVVGFITSVVILAARKYAHLDLGSENVADAVNLAVGYAAAYAVRDPRVSHAVQVIDHSAVARDLEDAVLQALGRRP